MINVNLGDVVIKKRFFDGCKNFYKYVVVRKYVDCDNNFKVGLVDESDYNEVLKSDSNCFEYCSLISEKCFNEDYVLNENEYKEKYKEFILNKISNLEKCKK